MAVVIFLLLRTESLFPENLIWATNRQYQTVLISKGDYILQSEIRLVAMLNYPPQSTNEISLSWLLTYFYIFNHFTKFKYKHDVLCIRVQQFQNAWTLNLKPKKTSSGILWDVIIHPYPRRLLAHVYLMTLIMLNRHMTEQQRAHAEGTSHNSLTWLGTIWCLTYKSRLDTEKQ